MSQALVVIPTFQEIENIERILRKVMSLPSYFDVLVVDDGSPDGTPEVVERLADEFEGRIHLLQRGAKKGLGTAYLDGFRWGKNKDYQFFFEMDADFSHNPDDLEKLYAACRDEEYDVAVGSRYVQGVNVVNWPMSRVLLSYFASRYVRVILGIPVEDTTAGFMCYRRKVLDTINFKRIKFVGYAFQIEMKYVAYKMGFKIKEVPVIFTDRTRGESKMSKSIIKEAVVGVLQLKVRNILRRYK